MPVNGNICRNKVKLGLIAFTIISLLLVSASIPLGQSAVNPFKSNSLPFSFINFNDNRIVFKPTENSLNRFGQLVERAAKGEEPIRILHIGDSHIQADMFTGETRRLLAQWLSDSSIARGFTFPYKLAGTNNPYDFEILSSGNWKRERILDVTKPSKLGIAGIALLTNDSVGQISVKLKDTKLLHGSFNLIRIYYDNEGGDVCFYPPQSGKLYSNEEGLWTYKLEIPVDSVSVNFSMKKGKKNEFRLYGIELLNTNSKIVYNAAGVNGAEVRTFLLSENVDKQIQQMKPHVVIVSLGTNDAYNPAFNPKEFHQNLTEFVCRIQQTNSDIMVILTTPGDHLLLRSNLNPSLDKVQEEIYRVANERDCGVWDFYRIMGGAGSIQIWQQHGLCAPDLLHLNRNGYLLQGDLLFNALVDLSGYGLDQVPSQELAEK